MIGRCFLPLCFVVIRDLLTGLMVKFQRTDDAFDVVFVNGICGSRIDFPQHFVQNVSTLCVCQIF